MHLGLSRQTLILILPFIIFILCFAFMGAYQPLAYPTGADWAQYMMGAQQVWWPAADTSYPEWRAPLYLYLLGLVAHGGSYLEAGSWLSSTGWFLMGGSLYGMALLFRRPVLGLGLSLALLCMPLSVDGFHHLGPYPLIGGVCGAVWLSALAVMRTPTISNKWLVSFAISSGFALALDSRSILIVVAALPLIFRRWPLKSLVGAFIAFSVAWSPHFLLVRYLKLSLLPMREKLLEQRRFVLRHLQGDNLHPDHPEIDGLMSVCAQQPPMHAKLDWLWETCSWEMMIVNLKAWAENGLGITLMWGILLFLSFRVWRWGLAIFMLIGLGLVVPMLIVWHPPRYAYPLMVPLLSSLPIAIVLVIENTPVPRLLTSLFALLPVFFLWPAQVPNTEPMTWDFPPARIPLVEEVRQSVNAGDHYMDCARLDTGLLWAPNNRMPANITTFLPSQSDCEGFIVNGNGWVLTKEGDPQLPSPLGYGWSPTKTFQDQNRGVILWSRTL